VQRFFDCAFSESQQQSKVIASWRDNTESLVLNTTIFPLVLWFHPVYLAAAYLEWTKRNMIAMQPELKGAFPE